MFIKYLLLIVFFSWSIILNLIAGFFVNRPISKKLFLFPWFEWVMTVCFYALWQTSSYFIPYFILFSALGITISTDLSHLLICRLVSIYLAPTGIILSYFQMLPLDWLESLMACIGAYMFFYLVNTLFFFIKKQDGIGQGDWDLIALIGAYTGLLGVWFTILCGSIIGTIMALIMIKYKKSSPTCLPFGPSLSLAAILFIVYKNSIIIWLMQVF